MSLEEFIKTTGGHLLAVKVEGGELFAQIEKDGHDQWVPIPDSVQLTGKECRTWLVAL